MNAGQGGPAANRGREPTVAFAAGRPHDVPGKATREMVSQAPADVRAPGGKGRLDTRGGLHFSGRAVPGSHRLIGCAMPSRGSGTSAPHAGCLPRQRRRRQVRRRRLTISARRIILSLSRPAENHMNGPVAQQGPDAKRPRPEECGALGCAAVMRGEEQHSNWAISAD